MSAKELLSSGCVLVTGTNGYLGRLFLQWASARQQTTRAAVRSEAAAQSLRDAGLAKTDSELAIVDYQDVQGLRRAAEGCDAAVHLVGIIKETKRSRYADAHEGAAEALQHALADSQVKHIVSLSILGAEVHSDNACLASRGQADEILLQGPVPTTVLRVPMVLGAGSPAARALRAQALSRILPLIRGGKSLEQPIAAEDVVAVLAAALKQNGKAPRCLDLAGPASLPHRELVLRVASLYGRAPHIVSVPHRAVELFAALAERFSADPPVTRAWLGVLEHDDCIDPTPACEALGIELTPLAEMLKRCAGPEVTT